MTLKQLQELIALAIISDKQAFIRAINATGNPVSYSISDDDLYAAANNLFVPNGFETLINILRNIKMDTSKLNAQQQNALIKKFRLQINPQLKCDWQHPLECVTGFTGYLGDLIGGSGSSTTTPTTQQQTSSSALSPLMIGITVVAGIIMIGIFRKFTAVVVGIIVIVLAVVLYGIFAKNISTSVSGGVTTTSSHGGIGAAILALFAG